MAEAPSDELADALLAFVRSFGLHRSDSTPCGVPVSVAEAHALMELSSDLISQTALCQRLGLTKSTVSRLVTTLEERGWVRRRPDRDDRRVTVLELCDDGRRAATRLAEARRRRFEALMAAVPYDQRAATLDSLRTLTAAARASDPRHA